MKISHKRKVVAKFNKSFKVKSSVKTNIVDKTEAVAKKTVAKKVVVEKTAEVKVEVTKPVAEAVTKDVPKSDLALTPKQQQVLDILKQQDDGLNPKGIGLEAGQEDAKAGSWATGALKKLVELSLVERVQLGGNRVLYKAL
ncbi:MarR family transcriptional regulator [Vibrio sp. SS-MA-C1-2]|uniref:MarR family transcriptional regulator n=1 Tax=Vibrio sp. SS-MA-C1-2 TaxID=2908646 RepID=UPI001F29D8F6|nr:MarR family transcriptional regulator [Vibrio sp. SS-MA-C1-2]UJF16981.1 MarR family transcriptional regulator [Vibrio sp. SS-MA-C1-2]